MQDQLSRSAFFAFGFFKRFAKLSILGIVSLGLTGIVVFKGAHMWVENAELAPDIDPETKCWEWDRDTKKWSGSNAGGTDPAFGLKGRHAVRVVWVTQNWGSAPHTSVVKHTYAKEFLTLAVENAEDVIPTGKLHPPTPTELTTRHADVLERMGMKDAIFDARSDYENVWFGLSMEGIKVFLLH
ncbi:hypothetical protein EDD16DRAFT_1711527 [Pisolithus croceorrhizus]|nr:hypothetical protein EDD16DRAFT_1711527 [Pisolithus croceorrhizus]